MITNFFQGLADIKNAFSFIKKNPTLLGILLIPVCINFILFISLGFLVLHYYSALFNLIGGYLGGLAIAETAWWAVAVSWVLTLVRGFLHVFLGTTLLALLGITMLLVSQIINSPFYDLLSESVEKRATGRLDQTPFSLIKFFHSIIKTIVIECKKIGFFILISVLLLFWNVIPLVGTIIYSILLYLFTAWDFGYNYTAYTMSRKLIPFGQQLVLAKNHKARLIGFGCPLLLPFFNILFAPIFVVGGTLLYLEIKNRNNIGNQ